MHDSIMIIASITTAITVVAASIRVVTVMRTPMVTREVVIVVTATIIGIVSKATASIGIMTVIGPVRVARGVHVIVTPTPIMVMVKMATAITVIASPIGVVTVVASPIRVITVVGPTRVARRTDIVIIDRQAVVELVHFEVLHPLVHILLMAWHVPSGTVIVVIGAAMAVTGARS